MAVPRAKVDPPRIDVGTINGSTPAAKTFKVTGERGLTFDIVKTRTSGEEVTVDVKVVQPGKEYAVTATVTLPAKAEAAPPSGDFKGWVHLITDQVGEYRVIAIPLVGHVKPAPGK